MRVFSPTADAITLAQTTFDTAVRAALSNIPSHNAVLRVKTINPGFYKFGDSTVVADEATGIFIGTGDGIELAGIPAGATHVSFIEINGGPTGKVNITVGFID